MAPPTDIVVSRSGFGDEIVDLVAGEEMEGLECVKDEVAHVLIHVGTEYTPVKVVYRTASVHDLAKQNKMKLFIYYIHILCIPCISYIFYYLLIYLNTIKCKFSKFVYYNYLCNILCHVF